jgi:hypothetical protein
MPLLENHRGKVQNAVVIIPANKNTKAYQG